MSILKREVLYSTKGNQVKFLDWALVTTTLGACAEPFDINERGSGLNADSKDYDPSDPIVKVDALVEVEDEGDAKKHLSGGGSQLNGGNLHPRVTIFTGDN